MELLNQEIIEQLKSESVRFQALQQEVQKVIVGNEQTITFIMIALLSNGHILLEGVPGVAKTTMIKTITQALGLHFKRIQFTPDLLPADLIGTLIYNPKTQEFETKKGPIFANLILADEINRTPAKVQAALLEAMQEQQVTIGSNTFPLDKPFLVFATQNPLEQEGTYRLPEAQIDRFMFKLLIDYLTPSQEKQLLQRTSVTAPVHQVLTHEDIFAAQEFVKKIYVDEKVIDYIISIVFATRNPSAYKMPQLKSLIEYGVSPRATLGLFQAAQAHAFLRKRHFVTPDDVKAVVHPLLRHRITLTYDAQADGIKPDDVITTIIQTVPTP
ncbi:MAG TPA: MoxR family ATPase [Candidatus Babeliales bacterium]|nr:MoxR family ATPase [Candidatus Babeliales bacterium]